MTADKFEWKQAERAISAKINNAEVELEINRVILAFIKKKIKSMPDAPEVDDFGKKH